MHRDQGARVGAAAVILLGTMLLAPGAHSRASGAPAGAAAAADLQAERLSIDASLADTAGSFVLTGHQVRFVARPGGGVTHDGRAVTSLDLASDAQGEPTVLASGSLRFFVIERAGHLGVRVRDLDNPHRRSFSGLTYFPVSTEWVCSARFEPYEPAHHLKIVNILGMEEEARSPGAVIFRKNGREW